jgi:hypothetical protein
MLFAPTHSATLFIGSLDTMKNGTLILNPEVFDTPEVATLALSVYKTFHL